VNNIALEPMTPQQLMPHTRQMLENETDRKKVNISEKVNQNIVKWITSSKRMFGINTHKSMY
jgi:hypothetical protein